MRACQNIKETVYTYDANGSQITKTTDEKTETNTYNAANQLVGFTDGETTASYTYNADGLRASKTVDGDTTKHVWDGAKQIIADVKNGAFYEADCYIRGTGLVAKYSYVNGAKSEYTYYTQNAHGDVVNLTDVDGIVIKTYKYDAFGVEKNIDDVDTNAFRYCGEYYDKETSTIYLRARHYNPSNGRFTRRDSFAGKQNDPLSLNLYTYCHNNPIANVDPSGHSYGTLPDGTKRSINSAWDAKQFNLARDKQLVKSPFESVNSGKYNISSIVAAHKNLRIDNIRNNGIEVMIEGKAGKNGTKAKKIDFNGNDFAVYLGVHDVAVWNYHTSIVVFAVEGSKYYNNTDLKFTQLQPGVQYTTIGAGPEWGLSGGNLEADYARKKDAQLWRKNTLKNLNVNDERVVDELFSNTKNYRDNSQSNNEYYLWPGMLGGDNHNNSNSFAHGLLDATGITVEKPNYNLPGWDDPVPKSMFGK